METEVQSLLAQTTELNQTENYNEGLESLARMENNSVNLDFHKNSSIPTVNVLHMSNLFLHM